MTSGTDIAALFDGIPGTAPFRAGKGSLEASTPLEAKTPEAALVIVEQFRLHHRAAAGWVCCADRLLVIQPGDFVPEVDPVLSAELCEERVSLHLRQTGNGYISVEITEASGDGDAWIVEHEFLSVRNPPSKL
jgi:hypothetical protein